MPVNIYGERRKGEKEKGEKEKGKKEKGEGRKEKGFILFGLVGKVGGEGNYSTP